MNYSGAVEYLYGLQLFGVNFGLENTQRLATLAGRPQNKLRFIHVAGTNGKGSVCAMLANIYRLSGLRVGLYTSPHLVSFRERIQVNHEPIGEADVVRLVEEMRPFLEQFPRDDHPTFFEAVTVIALKYFAEQKCDLVIWETGLGGRLDATNIVTPLASVITNIQFDHQQWLGDTLAKIAGEKAGIIKPGVPVITAETKSEALEVIRARADEFRSPLHHALASLSTLEGLRLSLAGPHQRLNAAAALETVNTLQPLLPVSWEAIQQGLSSAVWPGRFQVVHRQNQTLILDGAHNPDGMRALHSSLEAEFPGVKPAVIFGALADKNIREMCALLGSFASRLVFCPVRSTRSASMEQVVALSRAASPELPVTSCVSLSDALALLAAEPLVVVAGSLYLVGEAMELLNLSTISAPGEHALNEWRPKSATA